MSPDLTVSALPTKERLLAAAHDLIYRDGAGVGIEAICRSAQVSKRSMYQFFTSKDELIAASLDRAAPSYLSDLIPPPENGGSPRERILWVFERLEANSSDSDFRGCPFVAAAVELKSADHPGSVVARRSERALTDFFESEAERGRVPNPRLLAEQLIIAFDGASSHAVVQGRALGGIAVATASALLDQSGMDATHSQRGSKSSAS